MTEFIAYMVTNKVTNMKYIGITKRGVGRRWRSHVAKAMSGSRLCFHVAIREFGEEAFIVTEAARCNSWEELKNKEIELIAERGCRFPLGYNLTLGGQGAPGYKFTEEQIERLSKAHIGFKHSNDAKKRIAAASAGRLHTEQTKEIMSELQKKRYEDPAKRAAASARLVAYSRSEEGRKKASETLRKLLRDPAFTQLRVGQKRTDESKNQMRSSRMSFISTNPRAGELAGKLKIEQVAEIKFLLSAGIITQKEIANRFGIRQTQISNIKHGLCWKSIAPMPPGG